MKMGNVSGSPRSLKVGIAAVSGRQHMANAHAEFLEYLKRYDYFGRGIQRLAAAQYTALDAELALLVARAPHLEPEDVQRIVELKELLLRDQPKIEQLLS